jgi:hypothetical protein
MFVECASENALEPGFLVEQDLSKSGLPPGASPEQIFRDQALARVGL